MNIIEYLYMAVEVAYRQRDNRAFFVGSVGIRGDGAIVNSHNGCPKYPTPESHAESRLCRKLDRGAIVFVGRATKDGQWALSKPCADCQRVLRRSYVKKVYYTIGPREYGCMLLG